MSIFQRSKKNSEGSELDDLEAKLVDQMAEAIKKHDRLVVALATRIERKEQQQQERGS